MFARRDILTFGLHIGVLALGIILIRGFYGTRNNILSIVKYPHPGLRKAAVPIRHIDSKIIALADDMTATLQYRAITDFFVRRSFPKGLAAPQVGVSKKLIVCGLNGDIKVMVNPEILDNDGLYESYEGCLSVHKGGFRTINRSAYVKLKYRDLDNRERILVARNEDAALLEHEIDHLNGILNIDFRTEEEEQPF